MITCCWALVLFFSVPVFSGTTRSSVLSERGREPERIPLVRRLYGPENAEVRRNVAALEERMERYQTGIAPDPNHIVPYENHPYDKRNRLLRSNSTSSTQYGGYSTQNKTNLFQHIRIHFETQALDSIRTDSNAAKIDFIKSVVLPDAGSFWSNTLSVVPVSGNLRISSSDLDQRLYCGDQAFSQVGSEYISDGIANTDLILFVSASASTSFCQTRTLAVAVACNFDQFDRPTAGAVNVCLDNLQLNSDGTASTTVINDYHDVLVHEIAHVLGMSSNSYRFFYDPSTGLPRTTRPFSAQTVTCVDGTQRSLIVPGTSTMVFGQRSDGTRYCSIVTEKVRQIARNQFDCQTLEGAPLENQPTRADSCTGDHWDEKAFYPEALTAVISPTANIMTSLTLALMEDSGWYLANYTNSRMSPWGLGVGCDFVQQPCLTKASGSNPTVPDVGRGFFCSSESDFGCAPELTHKLACQMIDYKYVSGESVPEIYQYFPTTTLGGSKQLDFCPVYANTYNNKRIDALDCRISSNVPTYLNSYNEVYGANSKCFASSSGEGRCYEAFCVRDDMSLRFNVNGKYYKCEYDFQKISISITDGTLPHTITCPRFSQACPDLFCPFNCAGRGTCDYTNTVNGTKFPKCKCFDSSDTSPGCSDSLIPDGGFLDNSGSLLNNIHENFLDPFIALFTDKPSRWTPASWAWAAGLLAVALTLFLCVGSSFCSSSGGKSGGAISRTHYNGGGYGGGVDSRLYHV